MWKRLRAIANHPITPFIAAILMLCEIAALAGRPPGSRGLLIGSLTGHPHRRECATGTRISRSYTVERQPDGSIRLGDPTHRPSWSSARRDRICLTIGCDDRGFFHPTVIDRWAKLSGPFAPEHHAFQQSGRSLVADAVRPQLRAMALHKHRATLLKGEFVTVRGVSAVGIMRNVYTFALLIMLCWSSWLLLRRVEAAMVFHLQLTRGKDVCRHCGYSTAGLTRGVCPECGAEIGASAGMEPRP